MKTCKNSDCDQPVNARGMCLKHYDQWHYRQRKNAPTKAEIRRVLQHLLDVASA